MSFEIKKRPKVTVKVYGEVYELDRPTMKMADEFEKAASEGKENFKKLMAFIVALGLPKSVAEQMEVEDFTNLFNYMMPKKSA